MEYRTFIPEADDEAVLELRADVWGATHPHTSPRFLRWMLGASPGGTGSGVMMLEAGKVVGFAGLLPRLVQVDGERQAAAQCVDYMVHPRSRAGAGSFRIMSLWARLARDLGYAFGIGFPNENSREIVTRPRLGWKAALWPHFMVRPLPGIGVRSAAGSLTATALVALAALGSARAALSTRRRPRGEPFPIESFDARFDALWQQSGIPTGIRRDATYLQWRFVQQPVNDYLRIGWVEQGDLRGYVVATRRDLQGIPGMLVVDLLTQPGADDVARALLEEVVDHARRAGVHLLASLVAERDVTGRQLRRAGWTKVPRSLSPRTFVMTTHDLERNGSPAPSGWHFTWADTDVV